MKTFNVALLLMSFFTFSNATALIEDAEDGTISGWRMADGSAVGTNIRNILDEESNSRIIQFNGWGSHRMGGFGGDQSFHNEEDRMLSLKIKTETDCMIVVHVQTTLGLRHLFYTTVSHNRGLLHGFPGGIHHGLGGAVATGEWKTVIRDLERDLKDAEPANELLEINGFSINGGDDVRIDDVIFYTPKETIYENGEEGTARWNISDNTPSGSQILNIQDNDHQGQHRQGKVIKFSGSGADNAYSIGAVSGDNAWNNRDHKILQWRFRDFGPEVEVIDPRGIIRDPEAFEFRVSIETSQGHRDLTYTLGQEHRGVIEGGMTIHHALGDDRIRGSVWAGDDPMNALGLWQTITRDIEEDLHDFEPDLELVAINGFTVRNSGLVDDIKTLTSAPDIEVYEDAGDGTTDGWSVYSNSSGSATVTNVMDSEKRSRVIELFGQGLGDGFALGSQSWWNDRSHKGMQWSMNFDSRFTLYISVQTTNGHRYLVYRPVDGNEGLSGESISIGLGADADNGGWKTFTRNLAEDLSRGESGNELISINSFLIRGAGRLDDIETFAIPVEVEAPPYPNPIDEVVYEDAEDGNTDGWSVYDNTPEGAYINNVFDEDRNSRVIKLHGTGRSNGFMLGATSGSNVWNDTAHKTIRWSMKYDNLYTVYIVADTIKGRRYLTYTPKDSNHGITGNYIFIGLGSDTIDGVWHTFSRNIEDDIHQFESDNELLSINAFLIRGTGKVDDIVLSNQ